MGLIDEWRRIVMAHRISWDNAEQTVVLQEYLENASKDDLYLMAKESATMLATVEYQVHLIIDERNIQLTLNSADMRYLEKNVPPNQGYVIVIPPKGGLVFKKMTKNIGDKFAPKSFGETIFMETLEEAREFLKQQAGVVYG
jgi:hypothetical protein